MIIVGKRTSNLGITNEIEPILVHKFFLLILRDVIRHWYTRIFDFAHTLKEYKYTYMDT